MFRVKISGIGMTGERSIMVQPGSSENYRLLVTGPSGNIFELGSVTFENDSTGSFWFQIFFKLAKKPDLFITGPDTDLGSWREFTIPIRNPSVEGASFEIFSSTQNVVIDPNEPKEIFLESGNAKDIGFVFIPTNIGFDGNQAEIFIKSEEVGDRKIVFKGRGLPPSAFQSTHISAKPGKTKTIILPFRNPTSENIFVSVKPSGEWS